MDQKKTGAFLKALRMEKGLTQEQLAERFYVSGRTVSRWETGSNMPDLATLAELSEFYGMDIREIIDGERKSEAMTDETKDTLKKAAEYTDAEKKAEKKRMLDLSAGAFLLLLFSFLLNETAGFGVIPPQPCRNLCDFSMGLSTAILGLNILYLYGTLEKLSRWKKNLFKR